MVYQKIVFAIPSVVVSSLKKTRDYFARAQSKINLEQVRADTESNQSRISKTDTVGATLKKVKRLARAYARGV
jgi:hypothetical protein